MAPVISSIVGNDTMRTIIFTHSDSDGLCSGALALAANPGASIFFTNPVAIVPDIDQARGYDRIIICDIAINIPTWRVLKDKIDSLSGESDVIYLDHHPLPEGFSALWITSDTEASASEIAYKQFRKDLDPNISRVALYGAIGDYRDTTPFIHELLVNWDKRSLYYQAGTLSQGIEVGRRDYDFKRYLVTLLSQNTLPSEIETLAKNAIIASRNEDKLRARVEREVNRMRNISYVLNSNGCVSKAAIYARVYGRTPVGLAAEYREHKDVYDFSVRAINVRNSVNLNLIVSQAAVKNDGIGGGHPLAAGGRIPASRLKDFLLDLDYMVGEAINCG